MKKEHTEQRMISYSYRDTLKSDVSDELINTYLLRPIAGLIVWALYTTPITPNHVTVASILTGLVAALFYMKGTPDAFITAGLLVTLKDILDSADGQLARARQQYSRVGRFLDSIGDFIVDGAIFGVIGWVLYQSSGNEWMLLLAFLGLVGITLRVSYHVFYHVSYLHLKNEYINNRITEEVQEEDLMKGGLELRLQRIFQIIYGWQDRLMLLLDAWSARVAYRGALETESREHLQGSLHQWYSDPCALRLSSFLGFGTELFLLMVCSVFNKLELYLYLNLFLMNGIFLMCVFYRRIILFNKVQHGV